MPKQPLNLFDGHTFVYGASCQRAPELVWMYSVHPELPAKPS